MTLKFELQANDAFSAAYAVNEIEKDLILVHLTADAKTQPEKLSLNLSWELPDIGIHVTWNPFGGHSKSVIPNWGGYSFSCAMSGAPVYADLDYADRSRQTIACADAKNSVQMHTGVIEENGCLDCRVLIDVGCAVSHYETDVRIDLRDLPFYKTVDAVRAWWETYDGYTPAVVPDDAKQPLYSAWYSYHQQIDVPAIVEECAYFSKMGAKVLIVDDGWQTDDNARGYDFCGDWQPTTGKIPDMKAFVDAVHETGMKFMLWYSVPFVGEYSAAYERFKDKMLYCASGKTHVLDPRYPEVRDYLITMYKNAVLDWGLDGFKLDFVDSFRQSDTVADGMDYVSVYDAVDRLLKDVIAALKAMNPNILLEFRQSYIGPLMRTFGNMFRAGDCPADSYSNRVNTLTLRAFCGNTAVHSDMVMWHYDESAEQAAFQLTHVLFCVPQISVRKNCISTEQAEMIAAYLALWTKYRDVLLNGEMFYRGYAANFPYVSARKGATQVGAVYAGMIAYIEVPTDEIVLVNASLDRKVLIDANDTSPYTYTVCDCRGKQQACGRIAALTGITVIEDVPVNGVIVLHKDRG